MKKVMFFLCLFSLLFSAPLAAFAQNGLPDNLIRLTAVRGIVIVSPTGETKGEIDDLVLTSRGRVSHIVAMLESIPGLPDGRYLMPLSSVTLQWHEVLLNIRSAADLEEVPVGKRPRTIARDSVLLSDLLQYHVVDGWSRNLSLNVKDVVAEKQSGKIEYVVFSTGGVLGVGERNLAVPYGDVWYNLARRQVNIDISENELAKINGFSGDNWPAKADPQWNHPAKSAGGNQG